MSPPTSVGGFSWGGAMPQSTNRRRSNYTEVSLGLDKALPLIFEALSTPEERERRTLTERLNALAQLQQMSPYMTDPELEAAHKAIYRVGGKFNVGKGHLASGYIEPQIIEQTTPAKTDFEIGESFPERKFRRSNIREIVRPPWAGQKEKLSIDLQAKRDAYKDMLKAQGYEEGPDLDAALNNLLMPGTKSPEYTKSMKEFIDWYTKNPKASPLEAMKFIRGLKSPEAQRELISSYGKEFGAEERRDLERLKFENQISQFSTKLEQIQNMYEGLKQYRNDRNEMLKSNIESRRVGMEERQAQRTEAKEAKENLAKEKRLDRFFDRYNIAVRRFQDLVVANPGKGVGKYFAAGTIPTEADFWWSSYADPLKQEWEALTGLRSPLGKGYNPDPAAYLPPNRQLAEQLLGIPSGRKSTPPIRREEKKVEGKLTPPRPKVEGYTILGVREK